MALEAILTARTVIGSAMAFCGFLALWPTALMAAPTQYVLDAKASQVGFSYTLGGGVQKGSMPVAQASITVDPENLTASHVDITLNVASVRTALPFATQALIGPKVLDAAQFPTIRFVSTKVALGPKGRISGGAQITGQLTMHGITRPMTFDAGLFRTRGSASDDLSALTVHLTGQVSRSAYGATGYTDLVADMVKLDITAAIQATQ